MRGKCSLPVPLLSIAIAIAIGIGIEKIGTTGIPSIAIAIPIAIANTFHILESFIRATLRCVITLKNVTKRYPGAGIDVLAGIDLTIDAHDFVSIVGRSGSGKTTLLNLIGGLDSTYDGAIEVDGKDLRSFADVELLTCRENVSVAALFARGEMRREASWVRRRAEEVLATVGLDGAGRRRPTTLSGGERQRVALARALFHQPAILLCDEPTGNLDVETGREIVELLSDLHRNGDMTIIAATHDEMISAAGARVLLLREGRFIDSEGGGE